jgi:hypothetical protein
VNPHPTTPIFEEITMAEINANGQAGQPQLVLQKIYVKDASFEAPNAPQIFQEMGETEAQPQVQLNLGHKATDMGNDLFEVVLSLTLTCALGERTRPASSASPASPTKTATASWAPTARTCCSRTAARPSPR